MCCWSPAAIQILFVLNVGLQIGDGLLTYIGLRQGFAEGNPLIATTLEQWGTIGGLLFWKVTACGLLVGLRCLTAAPSAVYGLAVTAGSYLVLSVFPWLGLLLT